LSNVTASIIFERFVTLRIFLFVEDRVQMQVSACGVCLGQRVLGLVLFQSLQYTPYRYNSTKLRTILYVYYHCNLNFAIHSVVKIELKFKIFLRCGEWAVFVVSGNLNFIRSLTFKKRASYI